MLPVLAARQSALFQDDAAVCYAMHAKGAF